MQRGRKSAAAKAMQTVIVPLATRASTASETGLSPDVRAVYEEILRSVPRDHFAAWDLPLLRTYAGALVVARKAEGKAIGDLKALKAWQAAARVCAMLAFRLRVCPSARLEARAVTRRLAEPPRSYYDLQREGAAQ